MRAKPIAALFLLYAAPAQAGRPFPALEEIPRGPAVQPMLDANQVVTVRDAGRRLVAAQHTCTPAKPVAGWVPPTLNLQGAPVWLQVGAISTMVAAKSAALAAEATRLGSEVASAVARGLILPEAGARLTARLTAIGDAANADVTANRSAPSNATLAALGQAAALEVPADHAAIADLLTAMAELTRPTGTPKEAVAAAARIRTRLDQAIAATKNPDVLVAAWRLGDALTALEREATRQQSAVEAAAAGRQRGSHGNTLGTPIANDARIVLDTVFGTSRYRALPDLLVYYAEGCPEPALVLVQNQQAGHHFTAGDRAMWTVVVSEVQFGSRTGATSTTDVTDLTVRNSAINASRDLGIVPAGLATGVFLPTAPLDDHEPTQSDPVKVELHEAHEDPAGVPLYVGAARLELRVGSLNRIAVAPESDHVGKAWFVLENRRAAWLSLGIGATTPLYASRPSTRWTQADGVDPVRSLAAPSWDFGSFFDTQIYALTYIRPQRLFIPRSRATPPGPPISWDSAFLLGARIHGDVLERPMTETMAGLRIPVPIDYTRNRPWTRFGLHVAARMGPGGTGRCVLPENLDPDPVVVTSTVEETETVDGVTTSQVTTTRTTTPGVPVPERACGAAEDPLAARDVQDELDKRRINAVMIGLDFEF